MKVTRNTIEWTLVLVPFLLTLYIWSGKASLLVLFGVQIIWLIAASILAWKFRNKP